MRRTRIFERDDYRCVYCGERFDAEELSVDHVQPRVQGGDHSEGNLVTACRGCNTAKGHRRVSEYLLSSAAAREQFLARAVHLWPRIRRTLEEELKKKGVGG